MKSIAGKYGFASGSGGWDTTMTVASDGTFSGTYHDSDMGITGDDYPNGSVTIRISKAVSRMPRRTRTAAIRCNATNRR